MGLFHRKSKWEQLSRPVARAIPGAGKAAGSTAKSALSGLGVLVGGLKKVRAHDGSLELICSQERLLKIFRITGLAKVFVIHDSADPTVATG